MGTAVGPERSAHLSPQRQQRRTGTARSGQQKADVQEGAPNSGRFPWGGSGLPPRSMSLDPRPHRALRFGVQRCQDRATPAAPRRAPFISSNYPPLSIAPLRRYSTSPFGPPAPPGSIPANTNCPLCPPAPPGPQPPPPALTSPHLTSPHHTTPHHTAPHHTTPLLTSPPFFRLFPLFPPPSPQRGGAARTPPGLRREGGLGAEKEGRGEEKAANKQPHGGAGPRAACPRPPLRLRAGEGRESDLRPTGSACGLRAGPTPAAYTSGLGPNAPGPGLSRSGRPPAPGPLRLSRQPARSRRSALRAVPGRAGPWRGVRVWAGRWSPPPWSGSWRGGGRPCRYGRERSRGRRVGRREGRGGDAGQRVEGISAGLGVGTGGARGWGATGTPRGCGGCGKRGSRGQPTDCGVWGSGRRAAQGRGVRGVRAPITSAGEPVFPPPPQALEMTALHTCTPPWHSPTWCRSTRVAGGALLHVLPLCGAFGRRWGGPAVNGAGSGLGPRLFTSSVE